ncbi:MAG: gliding motility-associated C-terminal domain-containing protein [Saprospiraceae bacterium]|nr:gliding motility-associated C-terminal domain-containing protein [Saprospiraceae bacterium]
MSNLFRILLFVPPMFLFVLPVFSQVSGTLEQNPLDGTYTVSVISASTLTPAQSVTQGAGITLRAAKGTLNVIDLQSITGTWQAPDVIAAPIEAPNYDYFIFNELDIIDNLAYTSGAKIPMFAFKNSKDCTPIEIIDNNSDPLNVEPNSISLEVANFFSIFGLSSGGGNAYSGNDAQASVICPPITLIVSAATNPLKCYGDVTDLSFSAENGVAPYTVTWTDAVSGQTNTLVLPTAGSVSTLNGMPAGNYNFTITDASNESQATVFQLAQPAEPLEIKGIEALLESCTGSTDGQVYVDDVNGGTITSGDYHYQWAGYPNESSSTLSNVNAGTYYVTVTDDNGCSDTGSALLETAAEIELSNTTIKNVSCNGAANGLIDIYPVSPTFNTEFDFKWSSNVPTANESAAYQLGPGSYSVTITDIIGGCVKIESFEITEPPAIEVDYRLVEPKCHGEKGLLEIIGISNANLPWEAAIEGGESEVESGEKFLLEPGSPMKLVVTDAKGCSAEEDFIVAAKQKMQLEIGESQDIKYGEEVNINAAFFPFDNVSFKWTPADNLSCGDCPNPVATPKEGVVYQLEMTDSAGCKIDDFINIAVRKSRDIYIPNSFSPNFDGINDKFYPYGGFEIVAVHSMQVYDRWGGKMFESKEKFKPNEEDKGWDGSAKNKPADPGTYLYTMNVEFIDGEIVLFSGEVNLMR